MTLGIGSVVVTESPSIVRTVLGSCVALILHVPRLRISALCHAQMPEKTDGHPCPRRLSTRHRGVAPEKDFKYVSCCVRYMLDELGRRGVSKDEIVATLIGGGNVIRNIDARWSVAGRNVEAVKLILAREGIPISYSDTGGNRGRVVEHVSDRNHTRVRYHDGA